MDEKSDVLETEPVARKKRNKVKIAGIVAAIIVVVGAGFWVWHNTPGFCNAFCHTSMNDYVESYAQKADQPGKDKWGNEVANTKAMLAVSHGGNGKGCLDCHEPVLSQQLGEVGQTLTGDYEVPLSERSTEQLMVNSAHAAGTGDQFCLKSGCHVNAEGSVMTRADLTAATADMEWNPHSWRHGAQECGDCHKSHRASVLLCTECHFQAYGSMPEGWVDYATGKQIEEAAVAGN